MRLIYQVFVDHDLIVRRAEVENIGGEPIEIEQILSAAWHLPLRDSYELTSLSGKWGGEFQIQRFDLPRGKQLIERRRGSTGFDSGTDLNEKLSNRARDYDLLPTDLREEILSAYARAEV